MKGPKYRASLRANMTCRDAIDAAISRHINGGSVSWPEAVREVTSQFGMTRTLYVLANSVRMTLDERIYDDNRQWAMHSFPLSEDAEKFTVRSHPALLDMFVRAARAEARKTEEE